MAAQQVKLAFPVFFLLCANLLLGMATFYYAVKIRLPCNDTDNYMEQDTAPPYLLAGDDEADEEIILTGTPTRPVLTTLKSSSTTFKQVQAVTLLTPSPAGGKSTEGE
ncbi:hypothetical protein Trydic_g8933 [Trypoxylus dichotomus]